MGYRPQKAVCNGDYKNSWQQARRRFAASHVLWAVVYAMKMFAIPQTTNHAWSPRNVVATIRFLCSRWTSFSVGTVRVK